MISIFSAMLMCFAAGVNVAMGNYFYVGMYLCLAILNLSFLRG